MGRLDSSKVQEIIRKFFDAGNKQDLETLASLVAPSLTVNNPLFGQGNVVPREVFKASLDNMRKAFPDLNMHVVNMITQGDTVVTEELETATLSANGRSYKMPVCVVMRVNDQGQIFETHNYWDTRTLFDQLQIDLETYSKILGKTV
jgi:steroid delta-isomerase-like uncharacterized protein